MDSTEQINSILETLKSLIQLDFSKKAIITGKETQIDMIASGINSLGDKINSMITSKLELETYEQKFNMLLDNIPDMYFALDTEFNFSYWNKTTEAVTGILKNDAIGKSFYSVFPDLKGTQLDNDYNEVLLTGKSKNTSLRYEFKGRIHYFDISIYNTGAGIAAMAKDISGKSEDVLKVIELNNELEKKVQDRTKFLSQSQEIAHLGSWTLDLVKNKLYWSDEVYRIFDLQPQIFGATYESFLDAVHPDDRNKVDAAYTNSIKEGRDGYEIEHRLLNKRTGNIKYVFEKCRHERNALGEIFRSIGFVHDITERKKAEEAVKKSELRLKTAQKITKTGSWEMDIETGEITWSDELYKIYNCDPETFIINRESLINLIHPDDRELLSNQISAMVSGRKGTTIEFRLNRTDGNEKWISGQGELILDSTGKPVKAYGTAQDITENKYKEQALLNSLKEIADYKIALDESSIVAITDTKGIIKYANDNFCKISKFSRAELIGNDHRIVNSGYHSKEFMRQLWGTIRRGERWHGEIKNKAKDGTLYWVETTIVPFLNENGKPFQYVSIRKDISARKKGEEQIEKLNTELKKSMEQALANSESRLRKAQQIAQLGSWEINFETGEELWSDEMYHIYNCGPNTFKPTKENIVNLLHPNDREVLNNWINKVISGIKQHPLEFRLDNTDNGIKYICMEGELVFNTAGNLVRIIGTAQDITERKNRELELQKTAKDLSDRYNELMQFNYIVSHNLRAPVANILGTISVFMMPDISEEEKLKILDYINRAAIRMDEVITDLNEILETKSALNKTRVLVSIPSLIESISGTLENQIIKSGVILKTDIPENANEIITIKGYLESILYNLISNAIKYKAKERIPEIHISTCKASDQLIISVSDNGTGIDLKRFERQLFGLYKRFNSEVEGKGLGLFMTKTQVETLGGKISVESEPGKGTKFKVTLPIYV